MEIGISYGRFGYSSTFQQTYPPRLRNDPISSRLQHTVRGSDLQSTLPNVAYASFSPGRHISEVRTQYQHLPVPGLLLLMTLDPADPYIVYRTLRLIMQRGPESF